MVHSEHNVENKVYRKDLVKRAKGIIGKIERQSALSKLDSKSKSY